MSGLTSRAHLIRKCKYPTILISSSLTQLGASYAQKGFPKLTLIKHQTSASELCRCPFCFDIFMKEHSVITFLHLGRLILSYLSDSLLGLSPLTYFGITLEFAGPVFPRSTLLKTTDIQFILNLTFVRSEIASLRNHSHSEWVADIVEFVQSRLNSHIFQPYRLHLASNSWSRNRHSDITVTVK